MKNKYIWREAFNEGKKSVEKFQDLVNSGALMDENTVETRLYRSGLGLAISEMMLSELTANKKMLSKTVLDAIKSVRADIKKIKDQLDIISNPNKKLDKEEYSLKSYYSVISVVNQLHYIYISHTYFHLNDVIISYIRGGQDAYDVADQLKEWNNDKKAFLGR